MKYILILFVLSLAACEKDPVDSNNNNNNTVDSTHYAFIGTYITKFVGNDPDTAHNVIQKVITTSQDSIFIMHPTDTSIGFYYRGILFGDSISITNDGFDGEGHITESSLDYNIRSIFSGGVIAAELTYTGTAQ